MNTKGIYDLSQDQREILIHREAKRKQLRELYLKESGHPTKSLVYDAGIYRYASARASFMYHFVPKYVNFFLRGFTLIGAITALALLLKKTREEREHKFRTGQVPYKDRNKFV